VKGSYIVVSTFILFTLMLLTAVSVNFDVASIFQPLVGEGAMAVSAEYEVVSPDGSEHGQTHPVSLSGAELKPPQPVSSHKIVFRPLLIFNPPRGEVESVHISYIVEIVVNGKRVEIWNGEVAYDDLAKQYSLGLVVFDHSWLVENLENGRNIVNVVVNKVVVTVATRDGEVKVYQGGGKTLLTFMVDKLGDEVRFVKGGITPWRL